MGRPEPADRPSMAQASRLLAELAGAKLPATVLAGVPRNPTRPDLVAPKPAEPKPAAEAAPEPAPTTVVEEPALPPALPSAAFLPQGTQLADRPKPPPDPRKRALFIGAVVLVVILAGVGVLLANLGGGGQNTAGGSTGTHQAGTTTNQPQSPSNQSATRTTPSQPTTVPGSASPSVPPGTSTGTILYPSAGNRVLAFYSTSVLVSDPAQGWAMLSPSGQSYYGSETQFAAYWAQFTQVSSAHETGLSTNGDGSVQCPADVTYGPFQSSQTHHLNIRVIQVSGQVYLDSDTRIPGTSNPAGNTNGANNQ